MNNKKYTFCVRKTLEQKSLKTGNVTFLGLELTMHAIKSQIHLVRQSLEVWDYHGFSYCGAHCID
jgi:hypothetical protein